MNAKTTILLAAILALAGIAGAAAYRIGQHQPIDAIDTAERLDSLESELAAVLDELNGLHAGGKQ